MPTYPPAKDRLYKKYVEKLPSFAGKVLAVTGATSGIGKWIAVGAIRKHAAAVVVMNRPSEKVKILLDDLQKEVEQQNFADNEKKTDVIAIECDLSKLDSVRAAAVEFKDKVGSVDVLVCNGGVAYLDDVRNAEGFEIQMGINHFAHVLLVNLLLPEITAAAEEHGQARIIFVSSMIRMRDPLKEANYKRCEPGTLGGDDKDPNLNRYAQSKLANALFAQYMSKNYPDKRVLFLTCDPGLATTTVFTKHQDLNPPKWIYFFGLARLLWETREQFLLLFNKWLLPKQSAADGALPALECGLGEKSESGDFFSPKGVLKGKPVKVISKGKNMNRRWIFKEKHVVDEKAQKRCMELTQEALGVNF